MSATRYKRPHVDIFICIEMVRERNQGIILIKKHPVYHKSIHITIQIKLTQGALKY